MLKTVVQLNIFGETVNTVFHESLMNPKFKRRAFIKTDILKHYVIFVQINAFLVGLADIKHMNGSIFLMF